MITVKVYGYLARQFKSSYEFSSIRNTSELINAIDCNSQGFKSEYKAMQLAGVNHLLLVNGNPVFDTNLVLQHGDIVELLPIYEPFIFGIGRFFKHLVDVAKNWVYKHFVKPAVDEATNAIKNGMDQNLDENQDDKDTFGNSLKNEYSDGSPIPLVYGTIKTGSLVINKTVTTSLVPRYSDDQKQLFSSLFQQDQDTNVRPDTTSLTWADLPKITEQIIVKNTQIDQDIAVRNETEAKRKLSEQRYNSLFWPIHNIAHADNKFSDWAYNLDLSDDNRFNRFRHDAYDLYFKAQLNQDPSIDKLSGYQRDQNRDNYIRAKVGEYFYNNSFYR